MQKTLVNASNLYGGGSIQVSITFINSLTTLPTVCNKIDLIVSDKVDRELTALGTDKLLFNRYTVKNYYGFRSFFSFTDFAGYNQIFTIFGPFYNIGIFYNKTYNIVGFAQPWFFSSNSSRKFNVSYLKYLANIIKYSIQMFFFKKANLLIVEENFIKKELVKKFNINRKKIEVVKNCISNIFFQKKNWKACKLSKKDNSFLIGCLSRYYPHKNIDILYQVALLLNEEYKIKVKFILTLREEEVVKLKFNLNNFFINLGEISLTQCPKFYENLDAFILPSLMECSSSAPMEAIYCKKPIFLSDRIFFRHVYKDLANYFEPTDPRNIALVIYNYFKNFDIKAGDKKIKNYKKFINNISTSDKRTNTYLKLLKFF